MRAIKHRNAGDALLAALDRITAKKTTTSEETDFEAQVEHAPEEEGDFRPFSDLDDEMSQ